MSSMTVPERISDFLVKRRERMYCDSCIQERLGLKWRQQVQLITATLAVTPAFWRETNRCCTCQEIKQVTHAVNSQPRSEILRLNAGHGRHETPPEAHFGSTCAQEADLASQAKSKPAGS